jgi:hypothetical protein
VVAAEEKPGCGIAVGIAVFAMVGLVGSLFLLMALGMASDGCGQSDPRFACSQTGQELLPYMPGAGLLLGLAIAITGLALYRRWSQAPGAGLGLGVLVFLIAAGAAFALVG